MPADPRKRDFPAVPGFDLSNRTVFMVPFSHKIIESMKSDFKKIVNKTPWVFF